MAESQIHDCLHRFIELGLGGEQRNDHSQSNGNRGGKEVPGQGGRISKTSHQGQNIKNKGVCNTDQRTVGPVNSDPRISQVGDLLTNLDSFI